eukprot:scaffold232241_cov29-Tisochrysis_lutea.AAC.1
MWHMHSNENAPTPPLHSCQDILVVVSLFELLEEHLPVDAAALHCQRIEIVSSEQSLWEVGRQVEEAGLSVIDCGAAHPVLHLPERCLQGEAPADAASIGKFDHHKRDPRALWWFGREICLLGSFAGSARHTRLSRSRGGLRRLRLCRLRRLRLRLGLLICSERRIELGVLPREKVCSGRPDAAA